MPQHILSDEEYQKSLADAKVAAWAAKQVQAMQEALREKYGTRVDADSCPARKSYCDDCILQGTMYTPEEFMRSSPRCMLGYNTDFSK